MNSNNSESRIKLPDNFKQEIDINELQEKCKIVYDERISAPPTIIEVSQADKMINVFSYKSFSAVVGRQKSRKTFFISILMAACVKSGYVEYFGGKCDGKNNIYFDTEQTRYEVQWVNRRIIKLCGNNSQPPNLKTFSLRSLSVMERIEFIEYTMKNTSNIGFVVIDGLRDLVYDINNAHESTEIVSKIMQWSEDYNCHICNVLHLNKGQEGNLRGHLGTEVQNKAESIIEIEKDKENKNISIIRAKDFRGLEFEEMAMAIQNGLPIINQEYVDINEIF